jgi:hypothetical protein
MLEAGAIENSAPKPSDSWLAAWHDTAHRYERIFERVIVQPSASEQVLLTIS